MAERSPATAQAVITPEMLANTIKVTGQDGVFLIKGVARRIRVWPASGPAKWVYGVLALNEASIKFKMRPGKAPAEGEAVVLSATLDVRAAKAAERNTWTGAYELQLLAEKVGTWNPAESDRPTLRLEARPNRMPLDDFLEQHEVSTLTVLVSGKAEADLQQALTEAGIFKRPRIVRARFDDEGAILEAIGEAAEDGAHGLALARGGGAGLELIADSPRIVAALSALGLPFYSAQGHGDDVFLLDKYADQAFATPSILGLAIAQAETKVKARRRDRDELVDLRRRETDLKSELDRTRSSEQRAAEQVFLLEGHRARRVHVDRQGVALSWRAMLVVTGILALAFLVVWSLA
ncbi:exodeoxyribonuclease VII large subunit [Caulobacter segnis]